MLGMRLASIVFPAPGGPMRIRLCPPAAAISNALLATFWPWTWAKSRLLSWGYVFVLVVGKGMWLVLPRRNRTVSRKVSMPKTSIPSIKAASVALAKGKIIFVKPCFFASIPMAKAPLIGLSTPSSASSPIMTKLANTCMSTCSEACISDKAMGKS